MDDALRANLRASLAVEARINLLVGDTRLTAQERGRRLSALLAGEAASRPPLADAWKAAGRPQPLGYRYSDRADSSEWFEGWREVESLVLALEAEGLTRDAIAALIRNSTAPFDEDLEAEELGAIYRAHEQAPQE